MHPYNPYRIQYGTRNVSLSIQIFKKRNPNPVLRSFIHHWDHWINTNTITKTDFVYVYSYIFQNLNRKFSKNWVGEKEPH